MNQLPTIAGREYEICGNDKDGFWIKDSDSLADFCRDGQWRDDDFCSPDYWPTEAAAREFAIEVAGRENATPTLAEPGAKVGCGSLEAKIAGLIAANARHRDGTRLAEANWGIVLDHLESELSELRSGIACRDAANVLEELGDILGIVIHAVLKAGFTMAQVEARESAKLDERFTIPRKATP